MRRFLALTWWTLVAAVSMWVAIFVFGPPSVQTWQINAIDSVLQKMGF